MFWEDYNSGKLRHFYFQKEITKLCTGHVCTYFAFMFWITVYMTSVLNHNGKILMTLPKRGFSVTTVQQLLLTLIITI